MPVCSCCTTDALQPGKKKKESDKWRIFSLKELQSATNRFNYDNKLGEGGFGSVYWGQLWDGTQIAVKRLKNWSNKAELQFTAEIQVLAQVKHKNLLTLRGYCAEGQERLIVYDFMPNHSISSHLHRNISAECQLDWAKRIDIATGAAEGIAYLHHNATPHVIHRDIKGSNVLLDSEFNARVADFGFAKLIPDGATHVTTKVKGTLGYLAPEYAMLGKANESCDVFSFGILLLELASGKKPIERISSSLKRTIVEWALPLVKEGKYKEMVDGRLGESYVESEVKRVILVGVMCAQSKAERRPSMEEVVRLLKGELSEKLEEFEGFIDGEKSGVSEELNSGNEESSVFVTEEKESNKEGTEEMTSTSESGAEPR
ncbi:hypothetical protein LUZ60_017146 [Juncus effusus]|nr:hypothetical protein LUZ60_017146 [Juncus effusus]